MYVNVISIHKSVNPNSLLKLFTLQCPTWLEDPPSFDDFAKAGLADVPPSLQIESVSPSASAAAHLADWRPPPPPRWQRSSAVLRRPQSRGERAWAADAPVDQGWSS